MVDNIHEYSGRVLCGLFRQATGFEPIAVLPIGQQGSSRRYWRLQTADGCSLVGCVGTDRKENDAFVYLSGLLHGAGINVPEVLAVSDSRMEYLQSDLGSQSLYDIIAAQGSDTLEVDRLADACMAQLAKAHYLLLDKVDFSRCFPRAAMDARSVMWDLNYFKYCFLKTVGIQFDEELLQNDFEALAFMIEDECHGVLMLRDFQSRNIMVQDSVPWIIDFQGARRGPAAYDVASFAWQARVGFSAASRRSIMESYIRHAANYEAFDERYFRRGYPLCVLVRLLQVLGAYGFRGLVERKSKFITPIPQAVVMLKDLLRDYKPANISYLGGLLEELVRLPQLQPLEQRNHLVVEISSFSYKKGVPLDNSGNGGGFVFDCRAVHNPGRYDRYKHLTGLDAEVIEFLEENGEITDFLNNVYSLVDHAVERYMQRGFTHLCAHFGCTGGRHRSVYSAQHLAEHLSGKYGVEVRLTHREQCITQIFEQQ